MDAWYGSVVTAIVKFLLDGIFAQLAGFISDIFGNPLVNAD